MNPIKKFNKEKIKAVKEMALDRSFKKKSIDWILQSIKHQYNYNFSWMGRPIIKYPNDIVVLQELIWKVKPDLIIETGIAHGGSIIFSASMLKMMNVKNFKVIGIDIDIRKHNLKEILKHPMKKYIKLIEGSSIGEDVLKKVTTVAKKKKRIMVVLDSNHSEEHVFNELNLYSKFVSKNSYIVLPDTYIEFLPKNTFKNRPWNKGNNPYTALKKFLKTNKSFEIDDFISAKALITEAFSGYIKRIK